MKTMSSHLTNENYVLSYNVSHLMSYTYTFNWVVSDLERCCLLTSARIFEYIFPLYISCLSIQEFKREPHFSSSERKSGALAVLCLGNLCKGLSLALGLFLV